MWGYFYFPYRIANVWPARTMPQVSADESECLQLQRVCGHEAGGGTFQLQAAGGNHRQALWPLLHSGWHYPVVQNVNSLSTFSCNSSYLYLLMEYPHNLLYLVSLDYKVRGAPEVDRGWAEIFAILGYIDGHKRGKRLRLYKDVAGCRSVLQVTLKIVEQQHIINIFGRHKKFT